MYYGNLDSEMWFDFEVSEELQQQDQQNSAMRGYENKLWAVHRKDLHKTQQTHWASQPQETLWGAAVSRQGSQ